MIDADPQGSALDWAQRRKEGSYPRLFGVVGLPRETVHVEAPELAKSTDFVVIDGPPRITALARSVLLASDLVLVPVQPSPYDVWASIEMLAMIDEARVFRHALKAAFVVNRRVTGTVIGREVRAALGSQRIPTLASDVSQRIVFAESVAAGRVAAEVQPGGAAAREITALVADIEAFTS
jgi:chromosome partitioning protein